MSLITWSDKCDCCGEYVKSPYSFRHEDVWYSGHKRCMGAPMIRELKRRDIATKPLPNIALCGLMRSGKDAVASYLCESYGYARFAFGDELKRYAHELFDVSERMKPRELYQWFGQTMRERDPEIWLRKCFDRITDWRLYEDEDFRAVITDLRQPNEYERCRAEGYVILRVTAPDGVRIQRAIDAKDTFNYADLAHETESHVSSFVVDYEIENSGSLAELYARIDEIMADISARKKTAT